MDSCQAVITSAPSSGFESRSSELEMIVMTDSDVEEPATPLTPHPVIKDDDDGKLETILNRVQLYIQRLKCSA